MAGVDAAARALAEPHRRAILRLVRDREMTVTEIAGHFDISRPAISQHLRILGEADLVDVRPEGTRRHYRARPEGLRELRGWLDEFWSSRLDDLKREVEQERWRTRPARHHSEGGPST
jgi:DNA-binding transcriptional ArsR family regulator